MRDRIGGTGFHAISAKNTAVVVNVVNLGIALGAADALFRGVLVRLDIDAVGWTIGGAQKAGYTLLQAILVALQDVDAAIPLLHLCPSQRAGTVGIVLHNRGLEHLPKSDAHAFGNCGYVFQDRHTFLV